MIKEKWNKFKNWSNTWTGTIIIVFFIMSFIAQSFKIPSGSMKDTLLVGDMLFAKKFSFGIPTPHIPFLEIPLIPFTDGHLIDGRKPERGEIVIFRFPLDITKHFVKRCVALPGDELFLSNKNLFIHMSEGDEYIKTNYKKEKIVQKFGKLWVKNPYKDKHKGIHNEDYIINNGKYPTQLFEFPIIKIPENEYFMMGDNRDHSSDSRFWGTVPFGNLVGTPWFIWFSIADDWSIRFDRILRTPYYLEQKNHLKKAIDERKKEKINNELT
jgi:signal peptidase I